MSKNATVEVCRDCRGFAEAPHFKLVNESVKPAGRVLCLDCQEALLNRLFRRVLRYELGEDR